MLISTHVLAGALLGRAVSRPVPAVLLGVASHLGLDRLPHWGHAGGWPPGDLDADVLRIARVDGLTGLLLIALTGLAAGPAHRPGVLLAVAGACAPDLDKPGRHWFGRSPWPTRFDRFHALIQVDAERPELLRRDVAVVGVGAVLTLVVLRTAASD